MKRFKLFGSSGLKKLVGSGKAQFEMRSQSYGSKISCRAGSI